jgi:hypothetical protein
MSRTQLAFNSGDLAFQEIITSRPYRDSDRPIAPLLLVSGQPAVCPQLINTSAFYKGESQ